MFRMTTRQVIRNVEMISGRDGSGVAVEESAQLCNRRFHGTSFIWRSRERKFDRKRPTHMCPQGRSLPVPLQLRQRRERDPDRRMPCLCESRFVSWYFEEA